MNCFDIADDFSELGRARQWTREQLGDLSPALLGDVLLVINELAANALCHGAAPRQLRLARSRGKLRVEVDDASPAAARQRPATLNGGRGLKIVDALADAWDQHRTARGKTVWAEVALDPAAGEPAG